MLTLLANTLLPPSAAATALDPDTILPGVLGVFGILLIAGVAGGISAHLIHTAHRRTDGAHQPSTDDKFWSDRRLWGNLLEAVLAAVCVPLFLSLTSSKLLETAPKDWMQLFVVGGLGVVAALSASAFLDSLRTAVQLAKSAKFTSEEAKQTAAETKEQFEHLDEIRTEPDDVPQESATTNTEQNRPDLTDDQNKVLKAIVYSKWNKRSAIGVANELGMAKEDVERALDYLTDQRLLTRHPATPNRKSVRYSSTTEGVKAAPTQ